MKWSHCLVLWVWISLFKLNIEANAWKVFLLYTWYINLPMIYLLISTNNIHEVIFLNSSRPTAAYKRRCTGSALVQILACRMFGGKPLPEPMLTYCQLDPWKQTSMRFEYLKMSSAKWRPFCPGEMSFKQWLRICPGSHSRMILKIFFSIIYNLSKCDI